MVLSEQSTSAWENPSTGLHNAVCVDVIDLGEQTTTYQGETKTRNMLQLKFRIGDQDKSDGTPMFINRKYTATLNEKGALRKDLKSWRGQDLSVDEKKEFNPDVLVGAQAQLNIEEWQKSDGTPGTSIGAILPPANGQDVKVPDDYERVVIENNNVDDPF